MAWADCSGRISYNGVQESPTIEKYRDTLYYMSFFRHNADVQFALEINLPHSWDPRRVVKPHLYVIPMSNGSGTVRITGHYYWGKINDSVNSVASWTSYTVDTAYSPSDQYQERIIELATCVPPIGTCEACVLMLAVKRPGLTDSADTYSTNKDHGLPQANLAILSACAHYEPVKAGTQTEHGPV